MWKTAFKKFEVIWSSTNFTWSNVLALFTDFSVVTALLPIMAKLKLILSLECVLRVLSALTGKRVKGDDSAIKEHPLFCNHTADFKDLSILAANNDVKVTLMESLLVNRDHPPLHEN